MIKDQLQLFALLRGTKSSIEKMANRKLKEVGLTIAQAHIALFLQTQNNCCATLKEIEKELRVAQPTVVLMISKMEKRKFVTTYYSATDRRVKFVALTNKGKECADFIVDSLTDVQNEAMSVLSHEEKQLFFKLFVKITNNLNNT